MAVDFASNSQRPQFPTLLLAFLLALLALSHLYPQEAFGIRGLTVAAGLLVLFAPALYLLLPSIREQKLPRVIALCALAWTAWWIVRLAGAPVRVLGQNSTVDIIQGALVFFAAWAAAAAWGGQTMARRISAPRLAALWFVTIATIMAAHGLYQTWGPASLPGTHAALAAEIEQSSEINPAMRNAMLHLLREGRASGRFGSANIFAGLLAICLPIVLGMMLSARSTSRKLGLAAAAVLSFTAILAAGSRGGALAAAFGIILFAAMVFWHRIRIHKPATAFLALLLLAAPLFAQENSSHGGLARRWLGGSTVLQRYYYWDSGVQIWSQNWLFGRGPGAYQVFYFIHRHPGAQETGYAHNWFVQWGTETGLVGLLLFGGWSALVLAAGIKRWRTESTPSESLIAAGLIAAAAVALAGGLVEFTLSQREIYLDLSLILGIIAGTSLPASQSRPLHSAQKKMAMFLVAAITLSTGAALYIVQLRPAISADLSERALDTGDATEAVGLFTRAIAWQPNDPRWYESRAFVRLNMGDSRAYDDFNRALKLNPHSARLHQSMAQYLARVGRLAEAIEWQRKAVALHPLDGMHRMVLAEMLWDAGERDEPRVLLDHAITLIPNNEEVLFAQQLREKFGS